MTASHPTPRSLRAPTTVAPAAALPTRAMMLLAVATFSATANLRVSDSLLPQVAKEFSTSIGTAAMIVTAFSLAFGCFQLFYGPVGDRLGKYRVVMAVCFVSALATGACAFAPDLQTLTAARFLSGVASAAIVPLGMAWIGDVVPYEQRQGVLAKFLTGQILGMIFGQAAGGLLGDLIGWRWVFLGLGLRASGRRLGPARRDHPQSRPARGAGSSGQGQPCHHSRAVPQCSAAALGARRPVRGLCRGVRHVRRLRLHRR